MAIGLFSSDFNGTLVHQHSMSDLIRLYGTAENYGKAKRLFDNRIAGKIGVADLLNGLGPLSKGITLRQAIQQVEKELTFVDGFEKFLDFLHNEKVPLVLNSTGYSVTMYALREIYGRKYFDEFICNRLEFGWNADPDRAIEDEELEEMVEAYFRAKKYRSFDSYDNVRATGRVRLAISEESSKTEHLRNYLAARHPDITLDRVVHLGDTMGDSRIIVDIARAGGIGIAFNYNEPLEKYLVKTINRKKLLGTILLLEPKTGSPDLTRLIKLFK